MIAADAIVGLSVGLAFLVGVGIVVLFWRRSLNKYKAEHPESAAKAAEANDNGGGGGGMFAMSGGAGAARHNKAGSPAGKGKQPAYVNGDVDPTGQEIEMQDVYQNNGSTTPTTAVPTAHGEYGYSLDAVVQGHNNPQAHQYPPPPQQQQHQHQHQQDDEIMPAGSSSHSPPASIHRRQLSQNSGFHTPMRQQSPAQSQAPPSPSHSPVYGASPPPPRTPENKSPVNRSPIARSPGARSYMAGGSPVASSPAVGRSPVHHQQPFVPPEDPQQEVGRAI